SARARGASVAGIRAGSLASRSASSAGGTAAMRAMAGSWRSAADSPAANDTMRRNPPRRGITLLRPLLVQLLEVGRGDLVLRVDLQHLLEQLARFVPSVG